MISKKKHFVPSVRWEEWPKDKLIIEILDRMYYLYRQMDGSVKFQSSAEGDILKMVYVLLTSKQYN